VVPAGELEDAVCGLAAKIASNAPLSVKASKRTIGEILKDPSDRDLDAIAEFAKTCFDSQDYTEGRTAFMEKREPKFIGR
jgi:enoyl-CoA hydratase/carnithine racemase